MSSEGCALQKTPAWLNTTLGAGRPRLWWDVQWNMWPWTSVFLWIFLICCTIECRMLSLRLIGSSPPSGLNNKVNSLPYMTRKCRELAKQEIDNVTEDIILLPLKSTSLSGLTTLTDTDVWWQQLRLHTKIGLFVQGQWGGWGLGWGERSLLGKVLSFVVIGRPWAPQGQELRNAKSWLSQEGYIY